MGPNSYLDDRKVAVKYDNTVIYRSTPHVMFLIQLNHMRLNVVKLPGVLYGMSYNYPVASISLAPRFAVPPDMSQRRLNCWPVTR